MKIKINVRINHTQEGNVYTVWPRQHKYLPAIEFHTGQGFTLADAIADLSASLPDEFYIEDGISVNKSALEYSVRRPFDIVKSEPLKVFCVQ